MTANAYDPSLEEKERLMAISDRLFGWSAGCGDEEAQTIFENLTRPEIQWVINALKIAVDFKEQRVQDLEELANKCASRPVVVPFDACSQPARR